MNVKLFLDDLRVRFPNEPEYLQAVEEVVTSIADVYDTYPVLNGITFWNGCAFQIGSLCSVYHG